MFRRFFKRRLRKWLVIKMTQAHPAYFPCIPEIEKYIETGQISQSDNFKEHFGNAKL